MIQLCKVDVCATLSGLSVNNVTAKKCSLPNQPSGAATLCWQGVNSGEPTSLVLMLAQRKEYAS
jgi:hypothetical protein